MTLLRRQSSADVCFEFPSGEEEVRKALCELTKTLREMELSADDIGSAEVVLGEVLNNIVEHAYGAGRSGRIAVCLHRARHALRFHVLDEGEALPRARLPEGRLPALDGTLEEMPEGGFGWYLVHHIASDLAYKRTEGRNELAFSIFCDGQG